MNDQKLSFLGLCRKAGALACGHDAVIGSITGNRAYLIFVAADASERLVREVTHAASYGGKKIPVVHIKYTSADLLAGIGRKPVVLSVTDENFALKLKALFGEE